jgi:hypothetical protein
LIPDILTGEALIWYFKQQSYMPTFNSFVQNVLYHYGTKNVHQERLPSFASPLNQMKQEPMIDHKETVIESLRNQMLISNLEKLPKFSGKSKQNVSKWLRDSNQAMHIFKLTDDEKLFFISLCLEGDARDWFFDNNHLFSTWSLFTQKLIDTFESSGKADISFNRLRHYQQGLNQDVRQYYFEIMKLCKETKLLMDDFMKLQYLKDGLKPSLRFHVLLQNLKTPQEFLEYAQKVEELKLLDEKQDVMDWTAQNNPPFSSTVNPNNNNSNSQEFNQLFSPQPQGYNSAYYPNDYKKSDSLHQAAAPTTAQGQYPNHIPKPPYRCYKCGAIDHFIRDCPHFQ